jgi:hypothetical protein
MSAERELINAMKILLEGTDMDALQSQSEALIGRATELLAQPEQEQSFNWNDAQVICELNGYRWLLGPEAEYKLNFADVKVWCQSVGGELPPRDIFLQCFMNEDTKSEFKTSWYWSSTEFNATAAWLQNFGNGHQYNTYKGSANYVRAVKKVKV